MEQVSYFVYLGANISGDDTIDRDLEIFKELVVHFIRIYNAVVTILLYGAEV